MLDYSLAKCYFIVKYAAENKHLSLEEIEEWLEEHVGKN